MLGVFIINLVIFNCKFNCIDLISSACIVESWLDNEISNDELNISNYGIFRLDRDRHGSGILVYLAAHLSAEVIQCDVFFSLEFLPLAITCPDSAQKSYVYVLHTALPPPRFHSLIICLMKLAKFHPQYFLINSP